MKLLLPFKYALEGILYTIKTERHMRIHIVVATYVLVFAPFFKLSQQSYALLILTIILVMASEMVNTAIERVCNAVTKNFNPLIKAAKDVAAGAVLVCAIGAAVVGFLLFWQPPVLWQIISYLGRTPEYLTIFILSMVISVLFIVIGPSSMASNAKSFIHKD